MRILTETNEVKKVFGKQLKRLRESKGIMQKDLAYKLDIKPPSLSSYETGKQLPDLPTTKKIANFFGVTVDDLLKDTNDVANGVLEEHSELILDLKNGRSLDEIAAKQKIFVDGVELPIEQKKAILEQIEFQYRKWQESI